MRELPCCLHMAMATRYRQKRTDIHLFCLHSDIEVSLPTQCKSFVHILPVPAPNAALKKLDDAVAAPSNPN